MLKTTIIALPGDGDEFTAPAVRQNIHLLQEDNPCLTPEEIRQASKRT